VTEHPLTNRTLVVVGHPDLSRSRANAGLLAGIPPTVLVHDLAKEYGGGPADILAEQRLLESVDHIVLLYPTYWYAPPALLKGWLDDVMTRGWAYGTGAPGALRGKTLRVATTTGGAHDAYREGGFHGWEYEAVLTPMKATARRLGLRWLPPFVVHGVRDLSDDDLAMLARRYHDLLADTDAARPEPSAA
jgi:putative NADPH-quinone reductase